MGRTVERQRELLQQLRSSLVGAKHTLPFTIYNNNTIEALLKAQPESIAELEAVKGFPKNGKRVKGFGEAIVRIFTETDKLDGFDLYVNKEGLEVKTKVKKSNVFS